MAAPSGPPLRFEGLLFGTLIMALGIALLLDRTGVVRLFHYTSFWPFLMIAFGLVKLSHRRDSGTREGGGWVVFGVLILLNETDVLRFHNSWPLLFVALGLGMVWKEVSRRRGVA